MNPMKRKDLTPAKNNDDIGVADTVKKKFYKLNQVYLDVWLLCDGTKSEEDITKEYIKFLTKESKNKKVDKKLLKEEIIEIIRKLKKFNLVE